MHTQPLPTVASTLEDLQRYRELTTPRTIDVLLLRNWTSGRHGMERLAIEVKISRGDFARDSETKRAPWRQLAHRFAYCAPAGLLSPEDIPDGCWLIEISERPCCSADGGAHARHTPTRVHWNSKVKGSRARTVATPPELLVLLGRRASRAEARLLTGQDGDAAGALAEQLRRTQARLTAAQQREHLVKARTATLMQMLAPLGPQVCAECAEPIRPTVDSYGRGSWVHRTHEVQARCHNAWYERRLAEQEQPYADQAKQQRYAARLRAVYEIEPASVRAERMWAAGLDEQSEL